MITLLDEIPLPFDAVADVRERLLQDYLPGATARGMTLTGQWLSPPVALEGQLNTLWLQWQVADVMSYYGMRAGQGPELESFWQAIDALASGRRRHVMVDAGTPLVVKPEQPS